MQNMSKNRN